MMKGKRQLPERFHELQKVYTMEKTDEGKLKILQMMYDVIPPKKYEFNKVRAHTTKLMRLLREKMRHDRAREASFELSMKFFKNEMFSIALFGEADRGKTYLLNWLCGQSYPSTPKPYETKEPLIGVFDHKGLRLRMVEIPSSAKPETVKILRECNLIIVMPGNNKRFLNLINDNSVATPVKVLKSFPKNKWLFLGLIVVKHKDKHAVLFKGTTLNDLDLKKAIVNGVMQSGDYKLKDGDEIT